ncbi:enhancer of polycomb-like protein [Plasmopara halstedii]|uniref:Enhancer of polycomb-like protein n=1 Tax=Plasmopara halstedii TaxID=4781 RepID=A0A0N7L5B9_PLAHL|nr:enhancer of polycomb-like protein [Plasmopara halstedii]CEG41043.1 enhancer of polycomb-like protein [Plasmopara halstedii]|eukprot:XP_024577412.1 enhancer of polycomb-like protein [Plasmopara halstedii]
MRRSSLRPRQIDIHARMRIIREEEDLEADDDGAAGATQPQTSFQQLVANLEARQRAVVQSKRKKKDIPIPVILPVSTYDNSVSADFDIPTSYVRFQPLPRDEHAVDLDTFGPELQNVEVDLDVEDMRWLRRHPKYGLDGDPRYQLSQERFAQMLDALEKASALLNPNVMTLAEAEDVFAKRLNMYKTPLNRVTCDVYAYWAAKRQKLRRPLLRRFWPQTPLNDTNPHAVFRPREKERYKLRKHRKNDLEGLRKLQQLRVDFERVRRLLELVRRRERAKRLQLDFLDEIRRQAEHELVNRAGHANSKLDKAGVVEGPQIAPSFMEYDTSANFVMEDTTDTDSSPRDLRGPVFPSYPLSPPRFIATIFQQSPRYRCRARIGRGGRLVLDRIPAPSSRYYSVAETHAPTLKSTTANLYAANLRDITTPKYGATNIIGSSDSSLATNNVAVLVQDSSTHPQMNKINEITSMRLNEIYSMSDSEDELVEMISSSVYEEVMNKTISGGKGLESVHTGSEREMKFTLNI